jgi:membrane peptidoglycan carboxypeptidase
MKSGRTWWGVLGGLTGFIALSVVAGVLATAAVTPAVAVVGTATDDTIGAFDGLPDYIAVTALPQASTLYATQGGQEVAIASFYQQNRVEVGWNDIAQSAKDAAVGTEDPGFYSHGGVDVTGTIRGAILTALHKSVQGGSSITQQYVKNILVERCESMDVNPSATKKVYDQEYKAFEACYHSATSITPLRKLREMRYAIGLEQRYTKNQILEAYLNIAPFGGQVYGIQSAAEYYFGVSAADLTLPESATLIAILNNPNNLRIDEPTSKVNGSANGYPLTLARRNYVLDRMYVNGKITKADRDAALATKITPKITPTQNGCMTAQQFNAGFFCDYVEHVLQQDPTFGKTQDERNQFLDTGGLKIYTTLNLDLQQQAQSAISTYIPATPAVGNIASSNVSVEVGTGRIVTMVQSRPYNNTSTPPPGTTAVNYNTNYNYGGSQGFQTGSSFKMFDLIEWLKEGHTLNDVINTTQHVFPQSEFHESAPCDWIGGAPWSVANDDPAAPSLSVLSATAQSVNTAFAMMGTKMDLCGVYNDAKDLLVDGADDTANPFIMPPAALIGTNYIAPITMATAYAGIANGGVACSAIAIDKIVESDGSQHAVPKSTCSTTPIPANISAAIIYDLEGVLRGGGTAATANPNDGTPLFGKTGTTDNSLENWLVTSTTKVAQATWVGNISGAVPLRSISFQGVGGGNVKFSIVKVIQAALDKVYGGGQFPAVEPQFLGSSTPAPTTPAAPTTPTTPGAPGNGGPGNGGPVHVG